MAYEEGATKVVKLVTSLGSIFKYSVKGESEVSLKAELDIIDSYMKIQTIRFGSRLSYECNVPVELLGIKIPKMILQPIVENAVYHGLERQAAEGRITLSGVVHDNVLVLSVHDNGVGFNVESLNEVQKQISKINSSYNNGKVESIGITNVNNRLKLMYGEEYGLEIQSIAHDTTISLKIPKIN